MCILQKMRQAQFFVFKDLCGLKMETDKYS